MLRFKQFQGTGADLENAINSWLAEFEPDVTQMTQTVTAEGATILSFVFEESFRGQELRLSAEHHLPHSTTSAISPGAQRDDPIRVIDPGIAPADPRNS